MDLSRPTVDASVTLDSITTNCSSRPFILKDCKDLDLTDASVVSEHRENGRNMHPTSETKSRTQKSREYIQFVTLCWFIYLEGWNDGTNGPLLLRIQRVYGVGYLVVSLMFVFACLGFLIGALSNIFLTEKLGFGKVMVIGSVIQVIAYSIDSSAPPFPVFLFAYFINGIGLALQNAQSTGYVASLKENAETKMGILMAAYGAGASSAPLVATQFAQLNRWSFHYLTSPGIALINTVVLVLVFQFKRQEDCLAEIGVHSEPKQTSEHSHIRQIFARGDVHILAIFALLYVGAEVALGGWIVTYIVQVRGGGPSSGYISTGFYTGLMVGRVVLLWLNKKIGERLVLFIYAICIIGLEVLVWFLPSLVGDAIAVAIIGLLMGPMWPITMNHCGRVLPSSIRTGAIGWITGSGQAGSALMPFIAGVIASKAGISTLQPVSISIMVVMIATWASVPTKRGFEHN